MNACNVVIPAQVTFHVIPAQAGIQGALGSRRRGDDALRHLRGDDGAGGTP